MENTNRFTLFQDLRALICFLICFTLPILSDKKIQWLSNVLRYLGTASKVHPYWFEDGVVARLNHSVPNMFGLCDIARTFLNS